MPLPASTDWTDVGLAIDTGPFGSWDTIMEGITPAAVLRRGGTYLLYYVGAADYIADLANIGPAHRAIGVAVSEDGLNWTKAAENPVITFSSSGNPEEGAVSVGATLHEGQVLAFYGANLAATPTTSQVSANVRLATSADGISFADHGTVINRRNPLVWGFGDEIHGTLALAGAGRFHVFYVPNGSPQAGRLGVCRGSTPGRLRQCGPVRGEDGPVPSRGPSSAAPVGSDTHAVFVSTREGVDAYLADDRELSCFGAPVVRYPGMRAVFLLDPERRTWFAYYDEWTHIGVKVAAAGPRDDTPPAPPREVTAISLQHDQVSLTWTPGFDPETGILGYEVHRDGIKVGSTRGLSFRDSGLRERTTYEYTVRPVNLHGLDGPGASASVRTVDDVEPPTIETVSAVAPNEVVMTFSEAVAVVGGSYELTDGVQVRAALPDEDPRVVRLTTSPMAPGAMYTVTAHVADRSVRRNFGWSRRAFTASPLAGLIGYWRLDSPESAGSDSSGSAHHGTVHGEPAPADGRAGGAIGFDGRTYLEVPPSAVLDDAASSSISIAAWVRPADTPPRTTNVDAAYTVFSGPGGLSLKYQYDNRFVAAIDTSAGRQLRLTSEPFAPGEWRLIAMVVDATERTLALFADGSSVEGSPKPYAGDRSRRPMASPNHEQYHRHYRIGVASPRFAESSDFFRGRLDEVRVYRRALNETEIRQLR